MATSAEMGQTGTSSQAWQGASSSRAQERLAECLEERPANGAALVLVEEDGVGDARPDAKREGG